MISRAVANIADLRFGIEGDLHSDNDTTTAGRLAAAHTRPQRAGIDMHAVRQDAGTEANIHTTTGHVGDHHTEATYIGFTDR